MDNLLFAYGKRVTGKENEPSKDSIYYVMPTGCKSSSSYFFGYFGYYRPKVGKIGWRQRALQGKAQR